MSQSSLVTPVGHSLDSERAVSTIDAAADVDTCLAALDDDGCRAILAATTDTPRSARELSEHCDLALSTTYRKVDALTEIGLLEERTRIRLSGKHASEYVRAAGDIVVSIDATGEAAVHLCARDGGCESTGLQR